MRSLRLDGRPSTTPGPLPPADPPPAPSLQTYHGFKMDYAEQLKYWHDSTKSPLIRITSKQVSFGGEKGRASRGRSSALTTESDAGLCGRP